TIYTNHKNLEYFNSTKILSHRQHRWAEFLQPFNFRVIYREGRLNEKADAMSRRRDYRLEGGGNSQSKADQTFFALDNGLYNRSRTSCDHMYCKCAKASPYNQCS